MTARQIENKLRKANVSLEGLKIKRDQIEIMIGYEVVNGFGRCDTKKIEKKSNEIVKALKTRFHGFYTGYGSLRMEIGGPVEFEDFMDKTSSCHY